MKVSTRQKQGATRRTEGGAKGDNSGRYASWLRGAAGGSAKSIPRLFRVKHQQDAQHHHQQGPYSLEESLQAPFDFRETLGQRDSATSNRETEMLGHDVVHHLHMIRPHHARRMVVEEQQDRTRYAQHRKGPGAPGAL